VHTYDTTPICDPPFNWRINLPTIIIIITATIPPIISIICNNALTERIVHILIFVLSRPYHAC